MWQLENRTPFAAERTWVRDRNGAEIWLVAVKATFDFATDGSVKVSDDQQPVNLVPVYSGKSGESSLTHDSDLPRTKSLTDVILVATAHAPHGRPVKQLDVGFALGSMAKSLRVFGDRRWRRGRSISAPQAFTEMPITWERAYGGRDPKNGRHLTHPSLDMRNPVGTGWADAAEHLDGVALPNVEDCNFAIRHWNDRPAPAGFGVVSCHWQPRLALAGTYDEAWRNERFPLLPADFNDRHYQCAPADQQAPQMLRGGETVSLTNLTKHGGTVRFVLPRLHLGLDTDFRDGSREIHAPPKLHTVLIEPDPMRFSLAFHSALACHLKVLSLRRTHIQVKQDLRHGVLARPTVLSQLA